MICCVEDDASIREIEVYALSSTGLDTVGFENGLEFWEALPSLQPELVILDIMLPGMDGIELLQKMRETPMYADIPVIMASAKGQEYDKIKALDLGADDYLSKPFGVMEMVSRVKAVLRRCQPKHPEPGEGLQLNAQERTVYLDGERVSLTYKEFQLLQCFLAHPGMAFTRENLFTTVWNSDYLGDSRTLDMHIRTLRQKLGAYGRKIETVRNVGYRWENTK